MVESKKEKISFVIAKEDNGNIQITFTIPFSMVEKAQGETVAEMAKDIEIPGFRKGSAPLSKVREKISQTTLIEHSLTHILPQALATAVKEENLRLAIYPKFELISAKDNEPWQVRGTTCELPEINLGDYKEKIKGDARASNLWVPGKNEQKKEPSKEDKEQVVIKALLDSVKLTIPKILIEEEVSSRLSNLLARLEKLGLALESYLNSIGKTVNSIRAEYEVQAKDAIALDLILSKIAESENLKVNQAEIDAALNMSTSTTNPKVESNEDIESRKRLIESILKRRQALDFLISLA